MMKRTFDVLCQHGHCTRQDADTLCLSDDTAAWICGRLPSSNFVSFRVHVANFQHPNFALKHFKFEESLAQSQHVGVRYTYMNYTFFKNIVAIRLIVYTRTPQSNMYADGLPYFVRNFFEDSSKPVDVYVRKDCAIQILSPTMIHELFIDDSINKICCID